jgi:hypothetical protein
VREGEPLEGPEEPKLSAPPTPDAPKLRRSRAKRQASSPSLFD